MPLSWNEIKDRALKFSRDWAEETSEDAEAKSFLDAFFNVFGVPRRRVATFEKRVKKIDGKDGYSAARTIGRTVVFLVAPVTLAMFPSIARSAARSEKSNVLGQALAATGIVGCAAALLCSAAPGFLLKILFPSQDHSASAHLVPMFAWAFLPLAISSVLLNSLLAQARYGVVPCMILVPISYTFVLKRWHPSLESVIGITGAHAALLLLIMIVFTLRSSSLAPGKR